MSAEQTPVVQKYLACSAFDETTGECVQPVWVDTPGILPHLDPVHAFALSMAIAVVWVCIAGFYPIQDAIRDN